MKSRHLFATFFAISGLYIAHAQPTDQPPPKEPLLPRAPAFSSWTILFASANQQPVTSRIKVDLPKSITVVKTNRTYWEQATLQSGKKTERWIYNNMELKTSPETGEIIYVPPQEIPSSGNFNYAKTDFEGLDWLSLKNYQGIKKFEGESAYFFDSNPSQSNDPTIKKSIAYLSPDTQLPLYFSNGWITCKYTYNQSPSEILVPPENFMKVFKQLDIDIKETHRGPAGR